jgi:hypothetical protein
LMQQVFLHGGVVGAARRGHGGKVKGKG